MKFRPETVHGQVRVCGARPGEIVARVVLAVHGFLNFTLGMLYLTGVTLWKLLAGQAIIAAAFALKIVPESMKINKKDLHYDNTTDPTSDMGPYLNAIFYYVLAFGVVMAVCGIVVFTAACLRNKVLLILFATFAALQLITNTVSTGLLFSGKYDGAFKSILKHTLLEFRGIDTTEINSVLWNYGQIEMKCCGVDNYTDFYSAHAWRNHRVFDESRGLTINRTLVTPMACCKFIGQAPDIAPVQITCSYRPSRNNSNLIQGCWNIIKRKMGESKDMAIALCSAIIIWELIVFTLAVYLIEVIRRDGRQKQKYEDTNSPKKALI